MGEKEAMHPGAAGVNDLHS